MTTETAETPQVTASPSVFELFAAVKREVAPVGKDSKNEQQIKFRGIDAVVNTAAPALDKHGVITIPMLEDIAYNTVEVGKNRSAMGHVRVKVTYRFQGPRQVTSSTRPSQVRPWTAATRPPRRQ